MSQANPCIVQLGRYGDLINLLPVAKAESDRIGKPINWFVCQQYADLFDGVSYVNPIGWPGDVSDVRGAIAAAAVDHDNVIDTQVFGNRTFQKRQHNYTREEWDRAGYLSRWNDLPLVFDRRNPEREAALLDRFDLDGRPLVLVCTDGGYVEAPCRDSLAARMAESAPEYQWLSLDGVRADRIYDLLALLERAAAVVAVDSAILHLTYAAGTPTLALVADIGPMWRGTSARNHWIGSLRYRQIEKRWPDMIDRLRTHVAIEA